MNWYKKANQNIGDLYEGGDPRQPLGERIFESSGVWLYPFNNVKKDVTEGWYIDWFDGPGSIQDIEQVNIGDKVADYSLNIGLPAPKKNHPKVQDALKKTIEAAKKNDKYVMIGVGFPWEEEAQKYIDLGCQMIEIGHDYSILKTVWKNTLKKMKAE